MVILLRTNSSHFFLGVFIIFDQKTNKKVEKISHPSAEELQYPTEEIPIL